MKFKHLELSERKIIKSGLANKKKLVEIAMDCGFDPTTISKEIKNNRYILREGTKGYVCKYNVHFPWTCNHCMKKYHDCLCSIYIYDAESAENKYKNRLVSSRQGINISKDEFKVVNEIIRDGVENKDSIYHIVNNDENIKVSPSTIYRWIHKGIMDTKVLDLPFAPKYKIRKPNKKYDYSSSNKGIDRSNRTYLKYLEFKRNNPNMFTVQMDFLGTIRTDHKSILTLEIPELQFVLIKLIENPTQEKIVSLFNDIEKEIGSANFYKVFPCILTDRDPSFTDYDGIEKSILGGDNIRTQIFYCDPYRSNQKAGVENKNKQLRRFFEKGKSVDHYTNEQIKDINQRVNRYRLKSLMGFSPEEAFIEVYSKEILDKLYNI